MEYLQSILCDEPVFPTSAYEEGCPGMSSALTIYWTECHEAVTESVDERLAADAAIVAEATEQKG